MKHLRIASLLACLAGLLFSTNASAQALHLIAVTDSGDESIGTDVAIDAVNVYHFAKGVAEKTGMSFKAKVIASAAIPSGAYKSGGPRNPNLKGLTKNETLSPSLKFNKAALRSVLKKLKVGNDDVIWFHYAGHGFRWSDQKAKWPALDLGGWASSDADGAALKKVAEKSIQLQEVMKILEKKGARLTLSMSDSCNEDAELKMPSAHKARGKDKLTKGFIRLFRQAKGYIRASSTKPGELAWGDSDIGGVFSYKLITALMAEAKNKGDKADWKSLLKPFNGAISMRLKSGDTTDAQHPRIETKLTYVAGGSAGAGKTGGKVGGKPGLKPGKLRPGMNIKPHAASAGCPKGSAAKKFGARTFCVHSPLKGNKCRKGFSRKYSKKKRRTFCIAKYKQTKSIHPGATSGKGKSLFTKGKCPKGYRLAGKKGKFNRCVAQGKGGAKPAKACPEGRKVGKTCLVQKLKLRSACSLRKCPYFINTKDGLIMRKPKRKGKKGYCPEGKVSKRHRMCVVARIKTRVKQPGVCARQPMAGKAAQKLIAKGTCTYWVENTKKGAGLYRRANTGMIKPAVLRPSKKIRPKKRIR